MADGQDRPTFKALVAELESIGADTFGLAKTDNSGYLDVSEDVGDEQSTGFFSTLFRYVGVMQGANQLMHYPVEVEAKSIEAPGVWRTSVTSPFLL